MHFEKIQLLAKKIQFILKLKQLIAMFKHWKKNQKNLTVVMNS